MAARIWFILGAAWFILALAWTFRREYVTAYNFTSLICGGPHASGFSGCMSAKLPLAEVTLRHQIVVHDSAFIVLPALVLVLIGVMVRFRVRPAA
jgi:hypothetical protein